MPPNHFRARSRRIFIVGAILLMMLASAARSLPTSYAAEATRQLNLVTSQLTFVDSKSSTQNFDRVAPMKLDKDRYASYLSFQAPTLTSGEMISRAQLTVFIENVSAGNATITVHSTANSWKASTLTYAARPALGVSLGSATVSPGYLSINLSPSAAREYIATGASFIIRLATPDSTATISRSGPKAPVLKLAIASPSNTDSPAAEELPPNSPGSDIGPSDPVPSTNGKLVFAHYFPPYPISIDNKRPNSDYYQTHYLNPSGEGGKFAAVGGLLRDRPIPRDPLSVGNYRLEDLKTEVRQARASGIDGFAVDLLSLNGQNWDQTVSLLNASNAVSKDFKIMLQPDMTSSTGSASAGELANRLASLASYDAAYKINGKLVVSPYKAEAKSLTWWSDFMTQMRSRHGIEVAFIPVFLDVKKMAAYSSISYAFGEWGARNPISVSNGANQARNAHNLGRKWMAPVAVQDFRPVSKSWEEAGNTETLRNSWQRAISDGADFVLLATWNDYSETTTFAPSVQHGYTFLDITKYYATQFKTGRAPSITKDTLVLSHRIQDYGLKPTLQSALATLRSKTTPARNTVEVLSMLTAPATVTIDVGGTKTSYLAPAGISSKTVPLRVGKVSATAVRNGATTATVSTSTSVVGTVKVQDLGYHAATSTRSLPRQS